MKIYIARHGQVKSGADYYGDALFPKGEVPLSDMGRIQAELLGKRLKKLNFSGKIYSSPFWRTMETAELIAEQTNSEIVPISDFHEIFKTKEAGEEYEGSTIEALKKCYPRIAKGCDMPFPWWLPRQESYEDVCNRVAVAMDKLLQEEKEDFLIVGHGASTSAIMDYLKIERQIRYLWNCSLTLYNTQQPEEGFVNDTKHLPYDLISNNKDVLKDRQYQINIPEGLQSAKGPVLLHIGDTHSGTYAWYNSLIESLKPDIIVHTGDMADEIKAGRIPEVKDVYCDRLQGILDILKKAQSKVYLVPGNNDLVEEVQTRASFAEILKEDTVIDIGGKKICFAHEKCHISKQAEIYLYGHSERNEIWNLKKNGPEAGVWYLNSLWGVFVIDLSTRKLYCWDRPEYEEHIWVDNRN